MGDDPRPGPGPLTAPETRHSPWATVHTRRTVLAVVHNVTAATRLLDVLGVVGGDERVQLVFTVIGSSAFTDGTDDFLLDCGIVPTPWDEAVKAPVDLVISASYGGDLQLLKAPVVVVPHGMGYNKYLRRAGSDQPGQVFGLSPEWLLHDGQLIPELVVLSHPEQLDRLRLASPAAAEKALLAGDPCLDRMLAAAPLRPVYRRALGVGDGQKLVMVSSTWGDASLFGQDPALIRRLAARLPLDEYRIVVALHPNVWAWHSSWQISRWTEDCRRSGVRVLPAREGWQAALVAADVVIGDHGSVTFYGAAVGRPVLLASAPHDRVDPRSPIAMLLRTADRLHPTDDLPGQIERVTAGHDPARWRAITDLASSTPGRSGELLREAVYRLLGLDEPPWPADSRAAAVPPAQERTVTARLVRAEPDDDGTRIVRLPAEVSMASGPVTDGHVVVDAREPLRRWLDLADVVVVDDDADLAAVLDGLPGCLLGTAPLGPDRRDWVVRTRDGRGLRFSGFSAAPGQDGRVWASVVYAWLAGGRDLGDLPGRSRVRLGGRVVEAVVSPC
ncbi:hypothetical protein KIH74_31570 [Kineosporia sp. J2-2]|uniref:CDP-Glycerol:Poly(Glycerophosphate) glycerophosphotransferase n=1 Tax=Kineosporia corallincola TaxID=2835133 RepID=A0ABS5TRW0_9ACTN|nr:hypothetical protein [Kineosporia corallincola]MBT0773528.1 hypothetical protein [Kineosporia corallincola]